MRIHCPPRQVSPDSRKARDVSPKSPGTPGSPSKMAGPGNKAVTLKA